MARCIQHFEIDHIEVVRQDFLQKTGTQSDIVQLTPGGLAFSGTWVDLPGIRLEWNCLDSRVRSRDVQHEWGILFCFALPGSNALNFRGVKVAKNMAVLYRNGSRMDYVAGPGVRTLIVCVHENHLQSRAWKLGAGAFRQAESDGLVALERTCRQITDQNQWNERIESDATDAVLDDLARLLEPWMGTSRQPLPPKQGAFHFEVVEDVENAWRESGAGAPPTVNELVRRIGIPERTLYHAFNESVGMAPIRYLQLLRLHKFRDRLLEADPHLSSVSEVAHSLGYDQLGRLAGYYKRHFIETPSQTLRRVIGD